MQVKTCSLASPSGQFVCHSFTSLSVYLCVFLFNRQVFSLFPTKIYLRWTLSLSTVAPTLPHFTPEGVTAVAQWGLLALIGYWVLTIVLRLLIGVVRQVFWVVKTVFALWLFGLMVTDKTASADTTAVRLAGLVLACVLLTLLTAHSEKSGVVDHRLSILESRLKAVERRKGEQ